MSGMLKMDPRERLTALDALAHTYFDTVRDDEIEDLIKSRRERHTSDFDGSQAPTDHNRSKDISRRKTSTEKHATRQSRKNPYSLPLGASPPQHKKKKQSLKFYKDKKSSSSIKNLFQGRSSSKEMSGKRN